MPRVVSAVLAAAAAAWPLHAQDWGQLATISSTLGVNANRLCVGEGLRSDIGCPTSAPYINPATGHMGLRTTTTSGTIQIGELNDGAISRSIVLQSRGAGYGLELYARHDASNMWGIGPIGGPAMKGIGASAGGLAIQSYYGVKLSRGDNQSELMRLYSTGNATLGSPTVTVTPASRLTILGNTAIGANMVSISAPANGLLVEGNVGIATVTPSSQLEVNGTISATDLRLSGNLYVSGSQTFDGVTFANGGVSASGIITATSFSGDGSRLTGLASGDRITSGTTSVIATQDHSVTITTASSQRMVIGENGYVGIGTSAPGVLLDVNGSIYSRAGNVRSNTFNQYSLANTVVGNDAGNSYGIQFWTNSTQRAVITGTGNVGIGTTAPNAKLQVCEGLCVLAGTAGAGNIATFGRNGNAAITVSALSTNNSSIFFADQDDGDIGGITYYHSLDTLGFRTNNGDRMVLNGDGLGIGTTNPQATLQVSGSFTVSTSAQTTTPSLYVGTNGRIGLGTSSPGSELSIHGVNAQITMTDASATANSGYISFGNTPGAGGNLIIGTTSSGSGYGAVTIASAGPFRVNAGSAGYLIYGAQGLGGYRGILAINSPFPGTLPGAYVSGSIFVASTPSTNPSATLHVAGTGRITSWTTIAANVTPTTELDVYGTISATNILVNGAPITGTADRITSGTTQITANLNGPISFTTAGTERMIINSSGNVGIGTTSPAKNLAVSGTAEFTSRTLVGGTGTPSATFQVSGSLLLAGNDNIPCTASVLGLVRRNPTTGRMQACR